MPRTFLAAAACQFIFGLIWSRLEPRHAARIVGKTLEHAIAAACQGKAQIILDQKDYWIDGSRYEFDVATREEDRIVLIETKSKTLTHQSRSGDMFAFFRDYSDSFLRMVSQLVRHEVHLRQGRTPLTRFDEVTHNFKPVKVAVSPLSYGPVSDKMLLGNLVRAFVSAKLRLVVNDDTNQRVINSINLRAETIRNGLISLAPKSDAGLDMSAYLIDVFWLDVGQLLYILDRANTVWDAFSPLKHISFSSRDFWTELACADRNGLTVGKWRQLASNEYIP